MKSQSFAIGAFALLLASTLSWGSEQPAPGKHLRSLDEMTKKITVETRSDGSTVTTVVATEPIPWDEFVAAQAAGAAELQPAAPALTPELLQLDWVSGVCIPPDEDYDGDSFIGADDAFPEKRGEYIADRPRIVAEPYSYIQTSVAYSYTGSTEETTRQETLHTADLTCTEEVHNSVEIQKKFNGKVGISLSFSLANLKPTFGLSLDNTYFEYIYTNSRKWQEDIVNTIHDFYSVKVEETNNSKITWDEDDGRLSGQIKFSNLYDGGFGRTLILSDVTVHAVAYNPFTGQKYYVGRQTFSGPYVLPYGIDSNYKLDAVELAEMSTWDTVQSLAEARVFDFELANWTAVDALTGEDISALITSVNQRTARMSIHYGDATQRYFGQISIYQPDNHCLTGKAMLETVVPPDQLEFDRMEDGTLVVKRIFHRANRHADRDFWDLTAEERSEYGRWIVGFDPGPVNAATEIDLESTYLASDDVVFFYYLTAADFEEETPPANYVGTFEVANDGSAPASTTVLGGISRMDRVEFSVDTSFLIYNPNSPYTQYVDDIWSPVCGTVFNATWHSYNVLADSSEDYYAVPDADFYGMEIQIGDQDWMSISDLMSNENAAARMIEGRGYPYYDYNFEFYAHPDLFGDDPIPSVQVRNANPRQRLLVGYTGYDVLGRTVSCYYYADLGYFRNEGEVLLRYTIDDADLDLDGFYAVEKDGLDFDDASPRRFPFAPEHLDGIDNDGDGIVDEEPLLCPDSVESGMPGTCSLDDRMGWYEDNPNIEMQERLHYNDGSTGAWQTVGSVLEYPFVMSTDPNVSGLEVKAIRWTTPVPFEGSNLISRDVPCLDADGDGWTTCDGDCDDSRNVTYPGAPELCDGLDNNCYGTVPATEADADGDGYRVCSGDCNDGNDDVYPGATENCRTSYDDDCDGYVNEGCGGGSPIFRKPIPSQFPAD